MGTRRGAHQPPRATTQQGERGTSKTPTPITFGSARALAYCTGEAAKKREKLGLPIAPLWIMPYVEITQSARRTAARKETHLNLFERARGNEYTGCLCVLLLDYKSQGAER